MIDPLIRAVVPIALKETIEALEPAIKETFGLKIHPSHMLNPDVPVYIRGEAAWDIAFSNPWHLQEIRDHPSVDPASLMALGRSPLAFAVRGLGPGVLEASKVEDVRIALTDAKQIAITKGGTSGDMFLSLIAKLSLTEAIQKKVVQLDGGEPMRALLKGQVDLAALPLSNIAPIGGVFPKVIFPSDFGVHIDLAFCLSRSAGTRCSKLATWLTHDARNEQLMSLGIERSA